MKSSAHKTIAQTPAPKRERIKGSAINPKGSAESKKSGKSITFSEEVINGLKNKLTEYNKKHPQNKVSLATLKSVFRRGAGAYSSSHRPTISGGVPNSRNAWAYARVNKFLLKKGGTKVKAAYVQDDDLMEKGGIIAPNGKPSNLTPEQYKLVRTPEFKAWFGDWENDPENASKVVDENGEPKVMHHGTRGSFTIFSNENENKLSWTIGGLGFYFTTYYNAALGYGTKVISAFINARNIKKSDETEHAFVNINDLEKLRNAHFDAIYFDGQFTNTRGARSWKDDELVVFEPNQIKLADGSNTMFDEKNPDIRYEDGGETGEEITCHNCGWHWNTNQSDKFDKYVCHQCNFDNKQYYATTKNKNIMYADGGNLPVGKLAKGMSLSEVAAIHGLQADDLKSELKIGVEKEMEHTDHPEYARAIALDHLYEDPKYYTKSKEMEGVDSHFEDIKKKYAQGGKIDAVFSFKTPTGEASKLNYLQQVLVRTKSFKDFFGDWEGAAKKFLSSGREDFEKHYKDISKIIDYVTLEPKVLYHGTRTESEFFRFDVTKEKGVGRPYGYFAVNKEYSENFTTSSQRGHSSAKPYLYEVFLNVRNPFMAIGQQYADKKRMAADWMVVIIGTMLWDKYKTVEKNEETRSFIDGINSQIFDYVANTFAEKAPFWRLMARDAQKDFKYFLMAYNYDGIEYTEEFSSGYDVENPSEFTQAVTIFDSKQVKLADGRNLNFNPLIDDIRYDEGGEIEDDSLTDESELIEKAMNKKAKLGALLSGSKYAEGGKVIAEQKIDSNDAKKGGYFHGRSHAEGGIKAINKDTGQLIEVEGEEVIITKGAVNDTEKREFEGEMLTNREILSRINQSGGGVSFEDGGEVKGSSCGCSGKKYKYGGELMDDYSILKMMNKPFEIADQNLSKARSFVDDLVKKMK